MLWKHYQLIEAGSCWSVAQRSSTPGHFRATIDSISVGKCQKQATNFGPSRNDQTNRETRDHWKRAVISLYTNEECFRGEVER